MAVIKEDVLDPESVDQSPIDSMGDVRTVMAAVADEHFHACLAGGLTPGGDAAEQFD
jgi:hypothetical protein